MTKTEAVLDFPSGPVVGTQSFQCRGVSSTLVRELRSYIPHRVTKKKKDRECPHSPVSGHTDQSFNEKVCGDHMEIMPIYYSL